MNIVLERLILDAAGGETLTEEEFITDFRQNPAGWYAFRRDELVRLVDSVLTEVAALTDTSEVAPTGPTIEDLRLHFGLASAASEAEEQPVDWHGFNN